MIDNMVYYKGKLATRLNPRIIASKELTQAEVDYIKSLHVVRLTIEDEFADGELTARQYRMRWRENEFALQRAWGFPEDVNYHRFWYMKGCTCPKMDNDDAYPYGFYSYISDCPVHKDYSKGVVNENDANT